MNTKALRQKILDLAIHGKLVPQDPNDEPASVLLERIRAEKERLIKEGKIKKPKKAKATCDKPRYPFQLPKGWVWTTLGEICSKIGSGSTPKGSNYSNAGIPFFRSQNVYNTGIVLSDIKYISDEVHQSMIGTEVVANDLLLNITGGSLGRCAIVPDNFSKGNVSQHVCILRSILVRPKYLHAFILSSFFAKSMKITGSGREGLPKYNLEKMFLPLPPLNEQDKIIDKVDKFFEFVNTLESGEDNLTMLIAKAKSKILDLTIHGKLVPQDPNDEPASDLLKRINPKAEIICDNPRYGKLPSGWCETTLGNIISIKSGDAIKVRDNRIGKYPIYGGNGITGYNESYNVDGINIIIGRVGFYCGSVHYVNDKVWVTDNAFVTTIMGNVYTPKFLYYLLLQCDLKQYSNSTAQPVISGKTIYPIKVMLPPLSEQHRIVAKIEELFAQLDKIEASL